MTKMTRYPFNMFALLHVGCQYYTNYFFALMDHSWTFPLLYMFNAFHCSRINTHLPHTVRITVIKTSHFRFFRFHFFASYGQVLYVEKAFLIFHYWYMPSHVKMCTLANHKTRGESVRKLGVALMLLLQCTCWPLMLPNWTDLLVRSCYIKTYRKSEVGTGSDVTPDLLAFQLP